MTTRQIVLCHPVRTAIGTYGGSLKDVSAPELGAAAIRETLKRSGLAADNRDPRDAEAFRPCGRQDRGPGDGQRDPGRREDEPGAPGRHRRRAAGGSAGADGQSRLRIGGPRRGQRRAGNLGRHDRLRHRRRHGEHGPRALPAAAGPLGRAHGRRDDVRQHAVRRPERRLQRQALRLAHRGPGAQVRHQPRGPGPLGAALAAAFQRGAGGGQVRGRDRRRRGARPQGPDRVQQGRAQPARDHRRVSGEAQAGVPQGGHDHRRQCAGSEFRRCSDGGIAIPPGPRRTAWCRWRGW
jgi:hypothetical protein